MGFSIKGTVIAASILAPNLLMLIFPPLNVPPDLKDGGIVFTILERVGQIGCLALLVISKKWFQNSQLDIWIVLSALCILAYNGLWIRYVVTGRDFAALFSFGTIPIPMAILPVLAFGFAAIWGKSIWLGLATAVFAAGHMVNSWNTYALIK